MNNEEVLERIAAQRRQARKIKEAGVSLAALTGLKTIHREKAIISISLRPIDPGESLPLQVAVTAEGETVGNRYMVINNLEGEDRKTAVPELTPYAYVFHRPTRELCGAFNYLIEAEVFAWWLDQRIPDSDWGKPGEMPATLRKILVDMANDVESWNVCGVRGVYGQAVDSGEESLQTIEVEVEPVTIVQTDPAGIDGLTISAQMPDGTYFPVPNNGSLFKFYRRVEDGGFVVVEEGPE